MAAPIGELPPVRRPRSWPGPRLVNDSAQVAEVLAAVNAAGAARNRTQELGRVVDTGSAASVDARDGMQTVPAVAELAAVLSPWPGLRRGASVAAMGSHSLILAMVGAAQQGGAWCAIVGMPELGLVAAQENAVDLDRLVLVPRPGPAWPNVLSTLIDGFDLVVVGGIQQPAEGVVRSLKGRARQRGSVLVTTAVWPSTDLVLEASEHRWFGPDQGRGRIRRHTALVTAHGRGMAGRQRETELVLPPPSLATLAGRLPWSSTMPEMGAAPVPAAGEVVVAKPRVVPASTDVDDPWAAVLRGHPGQAGLRGRRRDIAS